MIKALLIDDEVGARTALKDLILMFCPQIKVIKEAASGAQALEMAKQTHFDIAFVDIQLKKMNGIDLAEQLISFCNNLIFVTAHDHYAVEAYKTQAIHYLLKPVDPQDLQEAVKRAEEHQGWGDLDDRLLLSTKYGVLCLQHDEIIHIQGDGNYCTFHCRDGKRYHVSKHLAHYEDILNSSQFFRIHQSHLINLQYVRQILVEEGYYVVLKNETQLPLARRRKEAFLQVLA